MSRGHCKQCHYYSDCKILMPQKHLSGQWNTLEEKREWMKKMMMDCFKSPEQYKRDIESAKHGGHYAQRK